MKIRFMLLSIFITMITLNLAAQNPRPLWEGDAYVGGNFDVLGVGGITTPVLSATETVTAATFIAGPSLTEINVQAVSAALDGYGLLYDSVLGDIALRPLGSSVTLEGLSDSAIVTPASGEYLQYNGANWINNPFSQLIEDLNNVVGTASDNDVLTYDLATTNWIPEAPTTGSTTLEALTDTAIITPASGEYLQYNGANWINNPFSQLLADLNDVVGTASDNDVLTYDLASGNWAPEAGGGGASALNDLSDVTLSGPALNEVLQYNGSAWVNDTVSGGAGNKSKTVTVASSSAYNASQYDLQADGTNDQRQIVVASDILGATGGTIKLSEGPFYFGAVLDVTYENIHIEGQGIKATTIYRAFNGDNLLKYTSSNNSSIKYLTIDGVNTTYTNASNKGLYIDDCDDFEVSTIYLLNNESDGLYITRTGFSTVDLHVNVNNTVSSNNDGNGFVFTGLTDRARLTNLYADTNALTGFSIGASCDQYVVSNCHSHSNIGDGFFFDGTGHTINGCSAISNSNGDGFDLSSATDCMLGNSISAVNNDGVKINNETVVTGCLIQDNSGDGIKAIFCDNSVIVGNRISANTQGIDVGSNTQNLIVGNNQINLNSSQGIYIGVDSSYCSIKNNHVGGNSSSGIQIDDADYTDITGNKIFDNLYQIYIEDQCLDTNIKGNTLKGNSGLQELLVIDDQFTGGSTCIISDNYFQGTYSTEFTYDVNEPVVTNAVTDSGTAGHNMILSSPSTARIAIATENPSVSNVIWVDQRATTNPIATSWDLHSDPALKENIRDVDDTERAAVSDLLDAVNFIEFDWKYTEPAPKFSSFEDVLDDSLTVIKSATEAYNDACTEYNARRDAYHANPIKKNQMSLDIEAPGFPDAFASYDSSGKKVGINLSQIVIRSLIALDLARDKIKQQQNQINQLINAGQNLNTRVKALEAQ